MTLILFHVKRWTNKNIHVLKRYFSLSLKRVNSRETFHVKHSNAIIQLRSVGRCFT